jgi:hypothetical protein
MFSVEIKWSYRSFANEYDDEWKRRKRFLGRFEVTICWPKYSGFWAWTVLSIGTLN